VGPLSTKQKFELFAGESVAPSRFLRSAAGAGSARREIPSTDTAREWRVRKTFWFFNGYGSFEQFLRNVFDFFNVAS